jgi:hypothetical protein
MRGTLRHLDFHPPGLHPDRVDGESALGGTGRGAAVAKIEASTVQAAHDLGAFERKVAHEPGRVGAAEARCVESAFEAGDADLAPVDLERSQLALDEVDVGTDVVEERVGRFGMRLGGRFHGRAA